MGRKDGNPRVAPNYFSLGRAMTAEDLSLAYGGVKPTSHREAWWLTRNGVRYEPVVMHRMVGFKVTNPDTEQTEYILLNPTNDHEVNVDNGAIGDTFVYHLDAEATAEWQAAPDDGTVSIIDFADPITYINHFPGTITTDSLDPEAL